VHSRREWTGGGAVDEDCGARDKVKSAPLRPCLRLVNVMVYPSRVAHGYCCWNYLCDNPACMPGPSRTRPVQQQAHQGAAAGAAQMHALPRGRWRRRPGRAAALTHGTQASHNARKVLRWDMYCWIVEEAGTRRAHKMSIGAVEVTDSAMAAREVEVTLGSSLMGQ
jgi:hypothetical protein